MKFDFISQYKDFVEKWQSRKLVLFGAGQQAHHILSTHFSLDKVDFICDNNKTKWGKTLFGIPICDPSLLADAPDDYVVIVCIADPYGNYSIFRQLKQMRVKNCYDRLLILKLRGIEVYDSPWHNAFTPFNAFQLIDNHKDDIQKVRAWLNDEKSIYVYDTIVEKTKYNIINYLDIYDSCNDYYFNDGIFEYSDSETLVDVGCYDGTVSIQFSEMLGDKFRKAIFFEPDDNNYLRSVHNVSKHIASDKYIGFKMGLSDNNISLDFTFDSSQGARFTESLPSGEGNITTGVARFDDLVSIDEPITFVKIDAEGQDLNALKGMQKSIQTHKPKLAISIYHKTEDLWTIPQYIKSLVPEYKLFVRHHHFQQLEKVLYATI
ncbi:MAG: FkbM family methyltransferase [Fibromonadaceae bacterium]|jgi:FkbM family methyltransferase|nr:FkbM family methyltransferase [Fibromonadaceae bacterium]